MTIVIEKNIPVPTGRLHGKYPFDDLEVGDSFLVPSSGNGEIQDRRKASSAVHRQTFVLKRGKYITRRVDGGIRIWRTA